MTVEKTPEQKAKEQKDRKEATLWCALVFLLCMYLTITSSPLWFIMAVVWLFYTWAMSMSYILNR